MPAYTLGTSGESVTPITATGPMRLWSPSLITYSGPFDSYALTNDIVQPDSQHTGSSYMPQSTLASGMVVRPRPQGSVLAIVPVLLGSTGDTMDLRVVAWYQFIADGSTGSQWFPVPLIQFTATGGAKAGRAGGFVDDTYVYSDALSGITDYTGTYYTTEGSTGAAMLFVDPGMAPLIQIDMRINSGAFGVNAIVGGLSGL